MGEVDVAGMDPQITDSQLLNYEQDIDGYFQERIREATSIHSDIVRN